MEYLPTTSNPLAFVSKETSEQTTTDLARDRFLQRRATEPRRQTHEEYLTESSKRLAPHMGGLPVKVAIVATLDNGNMFLLWNNLPWHIDQFNMEAGIQKYLKYELKQLLSNTQGRHPGMMSQRGDVSRKAISIVLCADAPHTPVHSQTLADWITAEAGVGPDCTVYDVDAEMLYPKQVADDIRQALYDAGNANDVATATRLALKDLHALNAECVVKRLGHAGAPVLEAIFSNVRGAKALTFDIKKTLRQLSIMGMGDAIIAFCRSFPQSADRIDRAVHDLNPTVRADDRFVPDDTPALDYGEHEFLKRSIRRAGSVDAAAEGEGGGAVDSVDRAVRSHRTSGGRRYASDWNRLVKAVHAQRRDKDPSASFKDSLKVASSYYRQS